MRKVRIFDVVLLVVMLGMIYFSIVQPLVLTVRNIQIQESYQKIIDPESGLETTIYQKVIIKALPQRKPMGHFVNK